MIKNHTYSRINCHLRKRLTAFFLAGLCILLSSTNTVQASEFSQKPQFLAIHLSTSFSCLAYNSDFSINEKHHQHQSEKHHKTSSDGCHCCFGSCSPPIGLTYNTVIPKAYQLQAMPWAIKNTHPPYLSPHLRPPNTAC